MKTILKEYPNEVHISVAELERANLTEWERLELHLLDQAAVVIPGQMTVMELLRTVEVLQSLTCWPRCASPVSSAITARWMNPAVR